MSVRKLRSISILKNHLTELLDDTRRPLYSQSTLHPAGRQVAVAGGAPYQARRLGGVAGPQSHSLRAVASHRRRATTDKDKPPGAAAGGFLFAQT